MTSPAPQPADGERACTTLGCEVPGTVWGIYDDGDERSRVLYCSGCAALLAEGGEFTPDPMTTPASAEPTEDEWFAASGTVYAAGIELNDPIADKLVTNMATVLASQRAEIVARYEKVADQLDQDADGPALSPFVYGDKDAKRDAARRIREAAPK